MKTKSILLAVMTLGASLTFAANPNPQIAVIGQKQPGTFKVIYEGVKEGKVKINIFDKSGSIVYSETIHGIRGFMRPVNFTGLEYGDYTIEIANAVGKQSQKISYVSQKSFKNTLPSVN